MSISRLGGILFVASITLVAWIQPARADGPYVFVTGRRDPRVIVIDLAKALDPANNGTPRAILSRVRISPDVPAIEPSRQDAKYIGVNRVPGQALPNNVIIPPGGKAYVVVFREQPVGHTSRRRQATCTPRVSPSSPLGAPSHSNDRSRFFVFVSPAPLRVLQSSVYGGAHWSPSFGSKDRFDSVINLRLDAFSKH